MSSRNTTPTLTPTLMSKDNLAQILKTLVLRSLEGDALHAFLDEAEANHWSARETMTQFAARELCERERRSLEWRLMDSRIRNKEFKPMADFDWGWPEKIDRATIEGLLTAEFVDRGENVILIGSHGLGKSMIAKNILHQAIHNGHTALFVEAAEMLVDLGAQDSARLSIEGSNTTQNRGSCASTRSDTYPTTSAPQTCSSRSSQGDTRKGPSSSPPTGSSTTGTLSSPVQPASSPSSTV